MNNNELIVKLPEVVSEDDLRKTIILAESLSKTYASDSFYALFFKGISKSINNLYSDLDLEEGMELCLADSSLIAASLNKKFQQVIVRYKSANVSRSDSIGKYLVLAGSTVKINQTASVGELTKKLLR